jgi:hypothetical protein
MQSSISILKFVSSPATKHLKKILVGQSSNYMYIMKLLGVESPRMALGGQKQADEANVM